MKVKVKGLVFAGFAAAVFAQSAMAVAPSQPTTTDLKTVTSKAYVDSKFNGTAGQVIIQGTDRGDTTYKDVVTVGSGNNNQMIEANDDALPTVSAVTDYVDAAVASGGTAAIQTSVGTNANDYVNFSKSGDTLTVEFDNAVVTAANDVTSANDSHLITSGGVRGYAEAVANKQTSISSADASNTNNYPTTGAVYGFAQPKVSSTTGVYVGKNDGTAATWDQLGTDGYVTTDTATSGVYKITLDSSKISTVSSVTTDMNAISAAERPDINLTQEELAAAQAAGDAAKTKLATMGAMYEIFQEANRANDLNFQRQVSSGSGIYVGKNENGESLWRELQASQTGAAASASYVTMTETNGVYTINLGTNQVDTDGTGVTSGGTKLLTGGSLHSLKNAADTSGANPAAAGWTGTVSNDTFPTTQNVKLYVDSVVAGLPTSETLPSECSTAQGSSYCALVAHYNSQNSSVEYEWTVMAPVPAGN